MPIPTVLLPASTCNTTFPSSAMICVSRFSFALFIIIFEDELSYLRNDPPPATKLNVSADGKSRYVLLSPRCCNLCDIAMSAVWEELSIPTTNVPAPMLLTPSGPKPNLPSARALKIMSPSPSSMSKSRLPDPFPSVRSFNTWPFVFSSLSIVATKSPLAFPYTLNAVSFAEPEQIIPSLKRIVEVPMFFIFGITPYLILLH